MKRCSLLSRALAAAFALCLFQVPGGHAQQPPQASQPAATASLEPKAIDVLKAACGKLAEARTMSFTAVVTYESPSRIGPPLAYTTRSEVTLKRPNGLRVITPADGPVSEFYYDGKRIAAFAPAEKLLAVADVPPTVDEALRAAFDKAAIYFPFTDLVVADPYNGIAGGLKVAFYIGQSRVVGGVTTDMVAYADDDVFVQAWIGAQDRLPRRLRAVYRKDPSQLRHDMELSNWKINPVVPAGAFAPRGAKDAKSIPFEHPVAGAVTGDRPTGAGQGSQKK